VKLAIHFKPAIVVALLAAVAGALWSASLALTGPPALLVGAIALFYSMLLVVAAYALWRCHVLEIPARWDAPQRLLILAPHEDDCVIAAGGVGARNRRLGGAMRIVYLVPDEQPGMAERRRAEAHAAWQEAGLDAGDLRFLDLLPRLRQRDPGKLRLAATLLRSIIDEFKPTVLIMPMFEGGHVQHDMTAALVGTILTPEDRFEVFEAPEYGPYTSLNNTPHRVMTLCARWLLGLVSYRGPSDGIDGRRLLAFRLDAADLACKRRMLGAFISQNAPSLVATYSYPDRLARWDPSRRRRHPYDFRVSYLRLSLMARRLMPAGMARRLFGVQGGAVGREDDVTDWDKEWALDDADGTERPKTTV
jgi:LmbE family N-acetylglucosaminyl deacetylase